MGKTFVVSVLCSLALISALCPRLSKAQDSAVPFFKSLGKERKEKSTKISKYFREGSYLIYDCEERHYACVSQEGHDLCQQWRRESYRRRDPIFSCAPLKNYKGIAGCQAKLYELMFRAAPKDFCVNHHLESLQRD